MDQQNQMSNDQEPQSETNGGFSTVTEQQEEEVRKHSGLGIASFVIAILGVILAFTAWNTISTGLQEFEDSGITLEQFINMGPDEQEQYVESFPNLLGGISLILVCGFIMFIGAILGLISLFQKRKKLFPIIGTVINGLPIVTFIFFMIIGLAMGG